MIDRWKRYRQSVNALKTFDQFLELPPLDEDECQNLFHQLRELKPLYEETPEEMGEPDVEKQFFAENRFDPNIFFSVLDQVSMQEGYELDYVYWFSGLGGYPIIFSRNKEESPIPRAKVILEAHEQDYHDPELSYFLSTIQFKPTPMGYFQFVLLLQKLHSFYLYWHAGYRSKTIVFSKDISNAIHEFYQEHWKYFSKREQQLIRLLDAFPRVRIQEDCGEVLYLRVNHQYDVYMESITLAPPNQILKETSLLLIESGTQICF